MRTDEIDWTAVGRDMDRGWELLSKYVWSPPVKKWVLRNPVEPEEN